MRSKRKPRAHHPWCASRYVVPELEGKLIYLGPPNVAPFTPEPCDCGQDKNSGRQLVTQGLTATTPTRRRRG